MRLNATVVGTPQYVLMESQHRIGPGIANLSTGSACAAIYGFSDKAPYQEFRSNSSHALTPYPLVKVYLRGKISAAADGLALVVIDATGPCEPCVHAATMEEVLEAQENRTVEMTASYRLAFDQEANVYRVDESTSP